MKPGHWREIISIRYPVFEHGFLFKNAVIVFSGRGSPLFQREDTRIRLRPVSPIRGHESPYAVPADTTLLGQAGYSLKSCPVVEVPLPVGAGIDEGVVDIADRDHLDLTGIAFGRAQAQHALSAMLGSAESAPDRRHRPDARKEAGLNFLSLIHDPHTSWQFLLPFNKIYELK